MTKTILTKTMLPTPCVICQQGPALFDSKVELYPGRQAELLGCASCRSYFLAPPISDEDIAECYKSVYHEAYSANLKKNFIKGVLIGKQLRRWKEKGRFLDVGCALGGIVAGVVHGSGWEGHGIEITDMAVTTGKRLFPNIQFHKGVIKNFSRSIPFDMIYVNNVLEHVKDPEEFLSEVFSRLKPGGRLNLIVPNGPVDISPNRLIYQKSKTVLLTKHGGHLFFFSRPGLEALFTKIGFEVVSWKTFHFISALKALGYYPGKINKFHKNHVPHSIPLSAVPSADEKSNHDIKFEFPTPRSIVLKSIHELMRYPFRYAFGLGYDFEIVLQKPG